MSTELNTADTQSIELALAGLRVTFVGKLGGINRNEAKQLVRSHGGVPVKTDDPAVDLLVIGADELPVEADGQIDDRRLEQAASGKLEIIGETQLWQRLGLLESDPNIRRLYTPAMLAKLLDVSVANIRRWHRRGLILAAKEIKRLPYFDFQEIAVARQLAQLVAAGESVESIECKLARLSEFLPDGDRPLTQLSVLIEGRNILLRQGEGLIEPGGQRRIDFESLEELEAPEEEPVVATYSFADLTSGLENFKTLEEFIGLAIDCEDEEQFEQAIEVYRAALMGLGPNAEICFRIGELLVLLGDLNGARERYYSAIELDASYIEARANLGCVLVELGQPEFAIAAFQGALEHHEEYPDVHFHLARIFDDRFQEGEAQHHWQRFLQLAPQSPWADEARARLES